MANKPTDPTPPSDEPIALADYRPVTGQRTRHDGWTAERQRIFLTVLAETGCISEACSHAGVSSRSAYRLRQRADAAAFANECAPALGCGMPPAFHRSCRGHDRPERRRTLDQALRLATLRLTTIAFERAVKGTVREMWREGERVAETRAPSDKLLMFLLQHLLPRGVVKDGAPQPPRRVRRQPGRDPHRLSRGAGAAGRSRRRDGADRQPRLLPRRPR